MPDDPHKADREAEADRQSLTYLYKYFDPAKLDNVQFYRQPSQVFLVLLKACMELIRTQIKKHGKDFY